MAIHDNYIQHYYKKSNSVIAFILPRNQTADLGFIYP